jgi:hypothetical protein
MSFHCGHIAFLNLSPFVRNARMNALGFVSKASTKFFHEVAPVALASVIGTILVNHYTHATAPAPVVVQPAPSLPDDAIVQTLHEEHQLIVDYLRRDAEAKEAVSGDGGAARRAPATVAARDGLAKARLAQEKAARRARPKVEGAQEPLPPGPDLASLPAPDSPPLGAGLIAEGSSMASAMGGFVAAAWQYPARALPNLSLADLPAGPWPFVWPGGVSRSHGETAAPR